MKDILKDLWKKKILVLICLLVCIGAGTITGYKKSDFNNRISKKDKERIEKYYESLAKYEQDVEKTQESIKLLDDKIKELREYIDNSIFMHLNPSKIYVASVQFSTEKPIKTADYLKDKYWNEVLSISNTKDGYNINIMHSSEEQALVIIAKIIKEIESKYKVSEPVVTQYIKTDANIVKKQKDYINNLNDYIKKKTDLENSLNKQVTIVTKFKSEAKPKALSEKELRPISIMLRYALFGFVTSILGLISVFTIKHIL